MEKNRREQIFYWFIFFIYLFHKKHPWVGGKFLLTSFLLLLSSSLPPPSLSPFLPSFFPPLRSSHLHIKYSFFSLSSFSGYSSGEWLPVVSLKPSSKSQLLGDISGVFPLQLSSPVFSPSSPSSHPSSIPCHPFPALKPRAPRGAGIAQLSDSMWCPCGSMDPCHCSPHLQFGPWVGWYWLMKWGEWEP